MAISPKTKQMFIMKKVFLSLLLAASAYTASAQITVIPKVGVSIANVTSKFQGGSISSESKVGLQLGAALEIGINEMFAIQPELLFIQKGGKSTFDDGFGKTSTSVTLNYLEIPVLVKVRFGNEKLKFHVNAGPSVGIAMSGTYTREKGGVSRSEDAKIGSSKDTDDLTRTDIGLQFGGGITFSNFVIDLRYGLGLSNTVPGGDANNSSLNRAIGITVGYAIPIGGK